MSEGKPCNTYMRILYGYGISIPHANNNIYNIERLPVRARAEQPPPPSPAGAAAHRNRSHSSGVHCLSIKYMYAMWQWHAYHAYPVSNFTTPSHKNAPRRNTLIFYA